MDKLSEIHEMMGETRSDIKNLKEGFIDFKKEHKEKYNKLEARVNSNSRFKWKAMGAMGTLMFFASYLKTKFGL